MSKVNKELTKAELEIMQIIWEQKESFMGDIVDAFPENDRPAYSTIQTVVKVLEKKNFVSHQTFGKVNRYYPLITKEEYRKSILSSTLNNFFNNSPKEMLSCLVENKSLSINEYEQLKKLIDNL